MSGSFVHSFFSSWGQSLTILAPKHLKTFLLLTVSTLKKVCRSLVFSAWWVLLICVLVAWFYPSSRLMLVSRYLLMFILIVASRSSVGLKTSSYFIEKILSYFPLYAFFALAMKLLADVLLMHYVASPFAFVLKSPLDLYVLVCGFFLLDSVFSLKALMRVPLNGFKMIMYNLPLFVLVLGAMDLLRYGIYRIGTWLLWLATSSSLLTAVVDVSLLLVFTSIAITIVSTIYIKRLYEQSSLYLY